MNEKEAERERNERDRPGERENRRITTRKKADNENERTGCERQREKLERSSARPAWDDHWVH